MHSRGVRVVIGHLVKESTFAGGAFGAVIPNQVIEHVRDLDTLVSEVARVLRDDGQLLLATPNLASWTIIAALDSGPSHKPCRRGCT